MLKKLKKLWATIKHKSPLYHAGYCAGQRSRRKPPITGCEQCGFRLAWMAKDTQAESLTPPARMGNFGSPVEIVVSPKTG